MKNKLTLITPTSDRPVAFDLCEKWMRRALDRFDGEVQWIVADDGNTPVNCTLGQEHVCRPHAGNKKNSFLGNLQAALERVRYEKVLFIEDDDWYAPEYLSKMSCWLEDADICGEGGARYYHLPTRRYRVCPNRDHASLCQTGIRGELIPWMVDHVARHKSTFIDVHLWKTGAKERDRDLHPKTSLSVGIKGLPGTGGIGVGHRLGSRSRCDSDGSILRRWMPEEDADTYLQILHEDSLVSNETPKLKTRFDVINYLIDKRNFHSYLEIGCDRERTFKRVKAVNKVGVDPVRGGTLRMSSDTFFEFNRQKFDLIFIDGLHLQQQVMRDVTNSIATLKSGGCIVVHDCLPLRREQQLDTPIRRVGGWTGNVWKAIVELRAYPNLDIAVLNSDWGVGVIFVRPNTDPIGLPAQIEWESFQQHRVEWLRVMECGNFIDFLNRD